DIWRATRTATSGAISPTSGCRACTGRHLEGNANEVRIQEKDMTAKETVERLKKLADEKYKDFNDRLIPGVENTLGVRLPDLRKLAKETVKDGGWRIWMEELPEDYYEELMLKGLVLGYARMPLEERLERLEQFVPKINNWGICDSCCMTCKFMKKEQEKSFQWLKQYLGSEKEFEVRFALVALLDHFVNEEYINEVLKACNETVHPGYYAKMAAAWAVSVCFVKFPEETFEFLENDQMDDFTHNKAIQKICESFRVSREMKEKLRGWKRKTTVARGQKD
ncbi:MAG: DNA alkylation repair protein, partial [Ruminococcus sp.]